MNIVLFESAGKQKYNAGSKARRDALKIAVNSGYRHIRLFDNGKARLVIALELIQGCFRAICSAGNGDNILIQYPYRPMLLNRILFGVLRVGRKIKKYDVSVLIHDLSGLRDEIPEDMDRTVKLKNELYMMRSCSLIYHNEKMRDVCENILPAYSYYILGLFDYLYSGGICLREYCDMPVVMVAGNLSKDKCGYVYELSSVDGVAFDLYGANYDGQDSENVRYRGKFSPEELILHLDGQFGLVWDGDTVETCGGARGNYLRYNNPHKLSLYIAAGVPLIVWKQSALAGFVEENGIGICVDSLKELPGIFKTLDDDKYRKMITNIERIKEEISNGMQLRHIFMDMQIKK